MTRTNGTNQDLPTLEANRAKQKRREANTIHLVHTTQKGLQDRHPSTLSLKHQIKLFVPEQSGLARQPGPLYSIITRASKGHH